MAISGDVYIDYVLKLIRRSDSPSTDVHTVNALYTHVMDTFDELAQMDDTVPMSAQTPTSYTMINGWYIQEALTQYLEGGAIQTSGYNGAVATLTCGLTGWTPYVAADIGDTIEGSVTSDTGVLLDYDNTYYKLWVRTTDTFANSTENYTGAGTGLATATAVGKTGEHVFANPYTLGTLEGTPQLYIFQDSERLNEWWTTGHFDVVVKVTESGVDINSKIITVFCRNWTDLYDHFEITLTTAGQNAVPLGTSDDLNNQTAVGTVEDNTDGTVASVLVDFSFTAPFTYDIGDGNGPEDYEVQIDCKGLRLSDVYEVTKYWTRSGSTTTLETTSDGNNQDGEEYRSANEGSYADVKAAPFGTFAGGKFFGARSVYFTNLHADDVQAFQLINKAGVTRYPPNYQSFVITSVVASDVTAIFLASLGEVVKEQYLVDGAHDAGATYLDVTATIPSDTPTRGTVIIVDNTDSSEEVLTYESFNVKKFILEASTVNVLGTALVASDYAYVPYVYEEALTTSVSQSVIYVTDRKVICRVRRKGIIPFETTGVFDSGGYSAAAIRTTDSIVS